MSITPVTTEDLRRMWNQDGLVIQGCGGDLNEWVDGINELLEQTGILRNGSKFESVMTFQNGETTCLLFPFEGVDADIGKLALWRLDTVAEFGGTWLSDYIDNRLGGFLSAEPEKPDCPLIGQDGNIFNLVGIAARTLRQNDMPEQAKAMTERVFASGSYNEALCIIGEYVNITSAEEMQERRSSVWQALQTKPEAPTPKTHKSKEPER